MKKEPEKNSEKSESKGSVSNKMNYLLKHTENIKEY